MHNLISQVVYIEYTNYKGERNVYCIEPGNIWFGRTLYHSDKDQDQWLMNAQVRTATGNENQTFTMKDIHSWSPLKIKVNAPDLDDHHKVLAAKGKYVLVTPTGKTFEGDTALEVTRKDIDDRVPPSVQLERIRQAIADTPPIDMILFCPNCGMQHIDKAEGEWTNPPHKSHLCRLDDGGCGHVWRPAGEPTNGVEKNTFPLGNDDSYPVVRGSVRNVNASAARATAKITRLE